MFLRSLRRERTKETSFGSSGRTPTLRFRSSGTPKEGSRSTSSARGCPLRFTSPLAAGPAGSSPAGSPCPRGIRDFRQRGGRNGICMCRNQSTPPSRLPVIGLLLIQVALPVFVLGMVLTLIQGGGLRPGGGDHVARPRDHRGAPDLLRPGSGRLVAAAEAGGRIRSTTPG